MIFKRIDSYSMNAFVHSYHTNEYLDRRLFYMM